MNDSSSSSQHEAHDHHSLSHAYSTYLAHDSEEQHHWNDVCRSYRQYATFAMAQWANHQYRLHALPEEQRQFLPAGLRREAPEFQQRAKLYKEAAIRNQFCLDCILRHAGQPNSQDVLASSRNSPSSATTASSSSAPASPSASPQHSTDSQMSKVSSVLKSLARDWSKEGKAERDEAYGPILEQVQRHLPVPKRKRKAPGLVSPASSTSPPPRLCVPGAGVGRLACELAALGYAVQGNEFSLYMLLASDFILNGGMATPDHPLQISPYLLESRNVHSPVDPVRWIAIPDVDPYKMIVPTATPSSPSASCDDNSNTHQDDATMDTDSTVTSSPSSNSCDNGEGSNCNNEQADFSMAAGEFVSIYSNPRERERWDGFVACFFLDTAPSIIEYIAVMHKSLKPGGFVFHFGPLLWHWSGPAMRPDDKSWDGYASRYSYLDKKYMTSMDLTWHDVRAIFVNVGFEIVEETIGVNAPYTSDQRSMLNMSYNCIQFVARKKGGTVAATPPSMPAQLPALTHETGAPAAPVVPARTTSSHKATHKSDSPR